MAAPDRPLGPRAPRSAPAQAKDALRVRLRAQRAGRTDTGGDALCRHGTVLARGHTTAALYGSAGHEPDTWPLIEALHAAGIAVLLPRLTGRDSPDWAWYAGRGLLNPGRGGISEPATPALGAAALGAATLVLCPALALTRTGHRLGTGGGWYDRALAFAAPEAVVAGLCFEHEILPSLPVEPWDRRVGILITPAGALPAEPE